MTGVRAVRLFLAALGLWLAAVAGPAQASTFSDWAAVVVAGDWHAHDGGPSEAFDNARRDVSQALVRAGFDPANIRQFSVRPELYKDTHPEKAEVGGIYSALSELAGKAQGGCLFYLTSHGAPQGALLDQGILVPDVLADMLDKACGKRPSIVVISACFSGVFVPELAEPNRMVLTAARPDRTSFGCGQDDKYPYFDTCFLSSIPTAHDFQALGVTVQRCVRQREIATKVSPPSEPQLFVGGALKPVLPLMAFDPPVRPGSRGGGG
jgi:hypothetical protein